MVFNLVMVSLRHKSTDNKGFTLVEMIVVFTITFILTATLLIRNDLSKEEFKLQRSAYKLAQDIRRMQATAGYEHPNSSCSHNPNPDYNYKYGYGVHFKNIGAKREEYILFSDCDGDDKYKSNKDGYSTEVVKFEEGVRIKDLKVDGSSVGSKLDIVFEPPEPQVYIEELTDKDLAEIIICLDADCDNKTKTIEVNRVGLIYVAD